MLNLGSTLKLLIKFVMVGRPFHINFTHTMFKSDLSNLRQKGRELIITVKKLPSRVKSCPQAKGRMKNHLLLLFIKHINKQNFVPSVVSFSLSASTTFTF